METGSDQQGYRADPIHLDGYLLQTDQLAYLDLAAFLQLIVPPDRIMAEEHDDGGSHIETTHFRALCQYDVFVAVIPQGRVRYRRRCDHTVPDGFDAGDEDGQGQRPENQVLWHRRVKKNGGWRIPRRCPRVSAF